MNRLQKLQRRINELALFLEISHISLNDWRMSSEPCSGAAAVAFDDRNWQPITPPALWGGYDATVWFRAHFKVPERMQGKPITLHLDLADEHGAALLFVNGKILAGIDANHQKVQLPSPANAHATYMLAVEAYAGRVPGPRLFRSARIYVEDAGVRDLFYTLQNALAVARLLPGDHPEATKMWRSLEKAAAGVDWRVPGSSAFRRSAARAARRLRRKLQHFRSDIPERLVPVGHAHIDVAWLWTINEVKKKCARTFATALHLMQRYPEYHFVQSQPQLYAFVKQDYPDLFADIKARVREGRWEPVGGMWVEPDTNIPSGESLVRQILYGKKFFRAEFGLEIDTLWLPDVFGYSAALPQILRKAGIRSFFTAKLAWNDFNRFPHSTFRWRGIDGSEVLAHLTFLHNLYNSEMTAADVHEAWQAFKQKGKAAHLLLSYGFGDGGGGPTENHLENARRLENISGLPRLERMSVSEFFRVVEKESHDLPVWWGELYLEYHRGTLTTQAQIKKANRRCELLLREAEFWHAIAATRTGSKSRLDLNDCWKLLLCNQFHDILPGSSIPEVYEQARRDYLQIEQAAESAIAGAQATLSGSPATSATHFAVFNSLSWARTGLARLPLAHGLEEIACKDSSGETLPAQVVQEENGTRTLLVQVNAPPAGYCFVYVDARTAPPGESSLKITRRTMENRWFRLTLNRDGQLTRLYDKTHDREVLAGGAPGNVLETYEDMPANWEAWDIDQDFAEKPVSLFRCTGMQTLETGPLRGVVQCTHKSANSTIIQKIILYDAIPRIDFETQVDWHEQRVLLKVGFPVAVLAEQATYEIQFGAISRPTHANTSWEAAKFEVAAHKWADLSEGNYGVSLLNDCKYGYDIRGQRMRLTLLRSPYPPAPPYAGPDVQHARPTDQGRHAFTYSLLPHAGTWRQAQTVRHGYELNVPLHAVAAAQPAAPDTATTFSFCEIDHDNIILDTLKPAEDGSGVVLRLYESAGQRGVFQMRFFAEPDTVQVCNLLEEIEVDLPRQNGAISLHYQPFEIITLKVQFKTK